MHLKYVNYRQDDSVAWITIDREEKLNAFNMELFAGLEDCIATAEEDESIRVIVITGAGDRAFVAGADIGELRGIGFDGARATAGRGHALMDRIECMGKPVIAAINGYALGGGCELALACSFRIASSNALLGLPEIKLGLIPGYGGTQRMARIVGRGRAMQMMLTGDPIKAEQALEWGLVTQVTEPGDLHTVVGDLARRLAESAPLAMAAVIRSVNQGADLPLDQGNALEIAQFAELFHSQDMHEGTAAFLEKRKPEFKGR